MKKIIIAASTLAVLAIAGSALASGIILGGGGPTDKDQCKKGGWETFTDPVFKNQGDCVSYVVSHNPNDSLEASQ